MASTNQMHDNLSNKSLESAGCKAAKAESTWTFGWIDSDWFRKWLELARQH